LRLQKLLLLPVAAGMLAACGAAWSQTPAVETPANPSPNTELLYPPPPPADSEPTVQQPHKTGLLADTKAYFTSPLRWDGTDWAWFGVAVAATAFSHRYDAQVRTHFVDGQNPASINAHDTQDAIPTVAVFLLTWGGAELTGSSGGKSEAWAMFEAAAFSGVTAYGLKYVAGREGPFETSNPNEWFKGGAGSFPSFHTTTAFAVGTVLAESGSDQYRWLRYLIGYGLGVGTAYERLKHNAHWLSDTVAGASLGIASAHFAMNHTYGAAAEKSRISVIPVDRGVMVAYTLQLD
jgi:membrane-associated phospholipid phosphatase